MRLAFIGDIVGRPGRFMIKAHLLQMRQTYGIDFVVANYENASHGFGLTQKNAKELFDAGIDVMTGGNHTWDKPEIASMLEHLPLLRPLNYPTMVAGKGYDIYTVNNQKVAVLNAMGHFSMPQVDNFMRTTKEAVDTVKALGAQIVFVDFHAEATSEKRALYLYLKDEISALIGTHTHVGTDDLLIDGRSAYLSDVGMTGCYDNVIGVRKEEPINRMITGVSGRFEVPNECKKILQMVIMDFDQTGACTAMQKIKRYEQAPSDSISSAWKI